MLGTGNCVARRMAVFPANVTLSAEAVWNRFVTILLLG